jgi:hypothetical protein
MDCVSKSGTNNTYAPVISVKWTSARHPWADQRFKIICCGLLISLGLPNSFYDEVKAGGWDERTYFLFWKSSPCFLLLNLSLTSFIR